MPIAAERARIYRAAVRLNPTPIIGKKIIFGVGFVLYSFFLIECVCRATSMLLAGVKIFRGKTAVNSLTPCLY